MLNTLRIAEEALLEFTKVAGKYIEDVFKPWLDPFHVSVLLGIGCAAIWLQNFRALAQVARNRRKAKAA